MICTRLASPAIFSDLIWFQVIPNTQGFHPILFQQGLFPLTLRGFGRKTLTLEHPSLSVEFGEEAPGHDRLEVLR